jgi:site-specific DNA-methyltransferase (adenine-specific)
MINLLHGDCLEQMKTLEDNSVDSIVSDPPYGISFMGCELDADYFEIAKARVGS